VKNEDPVVFCNAPSIHVTKFRVWTLRQFYHFLTLYRIIPEKIVTGIPYPKIYKTIPEFLTPHQYNRLIGHFSEQEDSSMGLRNLIIIMLHITTNQGFGDGITY
jgi:integrase/recombinase XerC